MKTFLLSLPLFLTLLLHWAPLVKPTKEDSIYDVLKQNGLPIGLLPKGVTDFVVDSHGNFEIHLDQACNAKFESELHYDRNVSGIIKFGQIGGLNGVSAQELFLWFPVRGIRVDIPSSGLIYFDVGVVYKQFALSMFESPRDCMAVRDHVLRDASDARFIARAVSQSQNGQLRCRLDQGNFGRGVL